MGTGELKGPFTDLSEPLLRKMYSPICSSFLVSSFVGFHLVMTLVMTSSDHALGHVTNSEKTQRLSGKYSIRRFSLI